MSGDHRSIRTRLERGASAVEYGLLISGVAAVIAAVVFVFGGAVGGLFQDTCDELASQTAGTC
ncbi:Flp family type IVb pilin [Nocardioides sp.]|jgi:pilus assembly protein Flp/PilA|uniref:Flp family type IVb pilin n=1 Tax=Nocardioides sp. TaxID=35761 RepID=UPI0031FF2C6A|nr:Pilus assembly protein [Nocardioides sp.]